MPRFTLDPRSLHRLRARLGKAGSPELLDALHDAGVASGDLVATRWREQLGGPGGLQEPEHLDTRRFGEMLTALCRDLGWGSLEVVMLGDEAVLLESSDWTEAEPGGAGQPGCRFTAGALGAFLTELAGAPLAVLEVECRSAGADRCRFLAGSPEMMALAWDLVSAGHSWRDAFASIPPH